MERHNFICKQVCRIIREYNPEAAIETEQVHHSSEGVRLKPDIVVTNDDTVIITDVVVAWDDRPAPLGRVCDL